jgi:hypothetical protein
MRERKSTFKSNLSHDDIKPVEIENSYNKILCNKEVWPNSTKNDFKIELKIQSKFLPKYDMLNVDENYNNIKTMKNTIDVPQTKNFLVKRSIKKYKLKKAKEITENRTENTKSFQQPDDKNKKILKHTEKLIMNEDNIYKKEYKLKISNAQLKMMDDESTRKKPVHKTNMAFHNFDKLYKVLNFEKEDKLNLSTDIIFNNNYKINEKVIITKNDNNKNDNNNNSYRYAKIINNNENDKNDNKDKNVINDNAKNTTNTNLRTKHLKSKDPKGCACLIF